MGEIGGSSPELRAKPKVKKLFEWHGMLKTSTRLHSKSFINFFLCFISIYFLTRNVVSAFVWFLMEKLSVGERREANSKETSGNQWYEKSLWCAECHEVLFAWDGESFSFQFSISLVEFKGKEKHIANQLEIWTELLFCFLLRLFQSEVRFSSAFASEQQLRLQLSINHNISDSLQTFRRSRFLLNFSNFRLNSFDFPNHNGH